MRKPRCIYPDKLYEVYLGTRQDRFFFLPIKRLTLLIIGALAYCQRKYDVKIAALAFLTNHAHLLVRAPSHEHVAKFFCLANSQIAQEVQRFGDWDGGIFAETVITPVTDEPEAQEERLKYILSQGVKEGLVPHPSKWPGAHFAKALLTGSMRMKGIWVARTKLWERVPSRRRKKGAIRKWLSASDYRACEEHLTLTLTPIPCWDTLSPKERVAKARALCREIQVENAQVRRRVPRDYRRRLSDCSSFARRPALEKRKRKNRNRPKVHAASLEEWQRWVDNLEAWYEKYRRASERLRLRAS